MDELKNAVRRAVNKQKENKDRSDIITEADLAEIEASLQAKNPLIKGSRFTNAQDFQFTSVRVRDVFQIKFLKFLFYFIFW